VRDLLVERDGLPPEKIRVIYNGVDVDRFASARGDRKKLLPGTTTDSKIIAVVANMHSRLKGHASLVRAAGSVCRKVPDILFLLIGEGQEKPNLEEEIKKAGLEKHFLFLGRRHDIPELLACCNMFVLPSETEALPNCVLEAMAAGLPVVATSVGGIPELIEDGHNGLLVPPKNPQALAEAILCVLSDSELAIRVARDGQRRMEQEFGFDRLTSEFAQVYKCDSGKDSGGSATASKRVSRPFGPASVKDHGL
jgi:glycosyltransferase involved in cell wall biosynthesis